MWSTDRVRVCVRELCRMNGLAYIPVTREEGLVLLASFAHISVETLSQTSPIVYIQAHLDDCNGDPMELIIKMCQMLGPYSYRNLVQHSLGVIKEEEREASTSVSVVSIPSSTVTELATIEEETPVTIEEATSVTVEEATSVTIEEAIPVPTVVIDIEPTVTIVETSSCCCFYFCQRRKR